MRRPSFSTSYLLNLSIGGSPFLKIASCPFNRGKRVESYSDNAYIIRRPHFKMGLQRIETIWNGDLSTLPKHHQNRMISHFVLGKVGRIPDFMVVFLPANVRDGLKVAMSFKGDQRGSGGLRWPIILMEIRFSCKWLYSGTMCRSAFLGCPSVLISSNVGSIPLVLPISYIYLSNPGQLANKIWLKTLPKAQRTRGLSSYHKIRVHSSQILNIFRISEQFQTFRISEFQNNFRILIKH